RVRRHESLSAQCFADEIAESVRAQSQTSSHRCDRSLPVALAREKYAPRGNRGDVRETSVCRKDPALGRFKFRRRRYAGTARHRSRFRLRHEPSPLQSRKSRDRIRSSTVPYIKHQTSSLKHHIFRSWLIPRSVTEEGSWIVRR